MRESRIALFACSHNEIDGVANTMRNLEGYAAARGHSLLLVHGGSGDRDCMNGTVRRIELRRKFPKISLDKKHDFDFFFWRYYGRAYSALSEFKPDLIHITGPSDVGMMGALLAHRMRIPLAASWHTNLHEYAAQRLKPLLRPLPAGAEEKIGGIIGSASLKLLARFYRIPRFLFAPNYELMELLQRRTGKPCYLMSRGVNVDLFSPRHRSRKSGPFSIGYVGRITVEKNVKMLVEMERELLNAGIGGFRFLIVGQGALEPWLKKKMMCADFTGVLHGERLAEAYANMDVFVFPSRTDTFGNVVLESLASGVPAIATEFGGPKFIVRHEETGFLADGSRDFCRRIVDLMHNPEKGRTMSVAARDYAVGQSWEAVFDRLFRTYERMLSADYAAPENFPTIRPDYSTAGASM